MKWNANTSQAQLEAQARYDSENTKQITLKLNVKTDADISLCQTTEDMRV